MFFRTCATYTAGYLGGMASLTSSMYPITLDTVTLQLAVVLVITTILHIFVAKYLYDAIQEG